MGGDVLLSRFRSTIGAGGLNVPVRDGKGWGPAAMVTVLLLPPTPGGIMCSTWWRGARSLRESPAIPLEVVGSLVPVSFDVTAFTPPAYQRGSLPRPSREASSRGGLRA